MYSHWYFFLSGRNVSVADNHRQICDVYGASAICEGKVRERVRDSNAGRDSFGWKILNNFSYSIDLAPSCSQLFRFLKNHLRGNYFNDREVVKTSVTFWLSEQVASFFEEDIQNSVVR